MAQGRKTTGASSGGRKKTKSTKTRRREKMKKEDEAKQDIERTFAEEEEKLEKEEETSLISESGKVGADSGTQSEVSYQASGEEQEKTEEGLLALILQVSAPVQNMIKPIKDKVSANIKIAKNMYAMFQGMKQMYGGDTKKTLSVIFGFAKQEAKRRLEEKKNKIMEKVKEKFK